MKYCIGCEHLYFQHSNPDDQGGSTLTGPWGGNNAEFACQKDHWEMDLGEYPGATAFDIEEAMRKAETCHDFVERRDGTPCEFEDYPYMYGEDADGNRGEWRVERRCRNCGEYPHDD
jgi:hypothetical protein